jgi:phage terminase small subunit
MKIVFFLLIVLLSNGCALTGTTTSHSRGSALATKMLVADYRAEQQKRIQEINHAYQEASGKVFIEMARLLNQELTQDFDREALALSEKYIDEWAKSTQPGKVAADLLGVVQGDFQKIRASEARLNEIRANYAKQYDNASVQLNLLQEIEANLEAVSKSKSDWKNMQETLQRLYKAYQDSQEEPGKEEGKNED